MPKPRLRIDCLAERHEGLTEALATSCSEAARVCLDRHHESPIDFEIDNSGERTHAVTEWDRTDDRMRQRESQLCYELPGEWARMIGSRPRRLPSPRYPYHLRLPSVVPTSPNGQVAPGGILLDPHGAGQVSRVPRLAVNVGQHHPEAPEGGAGDADP